LKTRYIIILQICTFCLFSSASAASEATQRVDSITQLLDKYYFSQGTLSRALVKELYQIAGQHPDDRALLVQAVYWESHVSYFQGNENPNLISEIDSIMQFYKDEAHPYEKTLLLYSIALASLSQNYNTEAFQYGIEALERIERLKYDELSYKVFNLLGTLCLSISNLNMADYYYSRALDAVGRERKEYAQILINKARILTLKNEFLQAVDSFTHIMPIVESYNDSTILHVAYGNLASNCLNARQYDKAYEFYQKALSYTENMDNDRFMGVIYQNLGYYYYLLKEYDNAHHYTLEAEKLASKINNYDQLAHIAYTLSRIFKDTNEMDSAFFYLQKYNTYNEHRLNNPKTVEVYQSYMTMLMEASENKLQIAEKDIVLKNRQLIIIVTVSGFIVLLISFFLLFMQYKKRQKEHENRELMAHLEHEKEIQAIEKQKQAELIDAKTREITSSSLLLSNKNNLLQQILELANLSLSNKGKAGEATQNIIHIVKTNLHIEEDWNNFMIHFDKVHPDFFEKMQSQYGNLTQNELKLCAYIRIGLSIKQIAQMLNISPASVKKNRYLLRKKLNLKEDENLDESIQHI